MAACSYIASNFHMFEIGSAMTMQGNRRPAVHYLKLFFLASFERGSLTGKPAQVDKLSCRHRSFFAPILLALPKQPQVSPGLSS